MNETLRRDAEQIIRKAISSVKPDEAVRRALGDIPFALEADVGHVKPCFTLINGALGHLNVEQGRATLEMELK